MAVASPLKAVSSADCVEVVQVAVNENANMAVGLSDVNVMCMDANIELDLGVSLYEKCMPGLNNNGGSASYPMDSAHLIGG